MSINLRGNRSLFDGAYSTNFLYFSPHRIQFSWQMYLPAVDYAAFTIETSQFHDFGPKKKLTPRGLPFDAFLHLVATAHLPWNHRLFLVPLDQSGSSPVKILPKSLKSQSNRRISFAGIPAKIATSESL